MQCMRVTCKWGAALAAVATVLTTLGVASFVQAQGNASPPPPLTVVVPGLTGSVNMDGAQILVPVPDSSKNVLKSTVTVVPNSLPAVLTNPNQRIQINSGLGQRMDYDYKALGKSGWPTCGGFVNGRLQDKCPPEPATFVAEAVGTCPAGSFLDAGAGSCWSCPTGYVRTADPITSTTACSRADASVPLRQMAATFGGGLCPPGSFFDPIRGGECYSCPAEHRRSAAHIDAPNACFIPAGESLVRAEAGRRTVWPHDCTGGFFHDAGAGGCYRCPPGYARTGNAVTSGQACSRAVGEVHARATPRGAAQCKPGEFHDPRNGGECWTCPAGTYRTVHPVNGGQACEQRAGVRLAKAEQVSAFSCPAGSFLDLISSRDASVRARIDKQAKATGRPIHTNNSAGGTCWTCPPGFDRDIYHVASDAACHTRSIKWQPAPYAQPGLFGLDGASEVARSLLADRRDIEKLIAAAFEDLKAGSGVTLAQLRAETYEDIMQAPQASPILAAAVYMRVEAAVRNPAQASAAERRLVASLAEAIRQYRVFIARNALDAYDQWVEAQPRQLSRDAEKAGAVSMEAQRLNQVAFKGGEVPPEFTEIVPALIAANVLAPAAAQSFLVASRQTPILRKAIFPHGEARRALRSTRADKAVGEGIGELVEAGAKELAKGAAKTSRLGSRVFSVAMKAGPQILVDLAVEMIVATAEHFEAVLNARPKLVTQLASAQQPVDLLREVNADPDWLYQQWSQILGNGEAAPNELAEFNRLAKVALAQGAAPGAPQSASPAPTAKPGPAGAAPEFDIQTMLGFCIRAQGSGVSLIPCVAGGQRWVSVGGALRSPAGNVCLTAGNPVTAGPCATPPPPAQQWTYANGQVVNPTGQCLEARLTAVVATPCVPNKVEQRWTVRQ